MAVPQKEKWVWLSAALKTGNRKAAELLSALGSVDAIFDAEEAELRRVCPKLNGTDISNLCDKSLLPTGRIISQCDKKGIRIITQTDDEYPERLLNIHTPPIVLYAAGKRLELDSLPAIAVVGTRRASGNGENAAEKLGYELALGGAVVVSGLALGIDAAAMKGALYAGGTTVAVLGCGVDICYPRENKTLYEKILENGTIISEYPPGEKPTRGSFPARNRIISGITLGTLVVEAPTRSGALITASLALEQDRDLFAVPSGIFDETGEGTNKLIREGAIPVLSGKDVLSEYKNLFGDRININFEADSLVFKQKENKREEENRREEKREKSKAPEKVFDVSSFSEDEQKILKTLLKEPRRPDEISAESGLLPQKALSLITLLEIRGVIVRQNGNKFRLIER